MTAFSLFRWNLHTKLTSRSRTQDKGTWQSTHSEKANSIQHVKHTAYTGTHVGHVRRDNFEDWEFCWTSNGTWPETCFFKLHFPLLLASFSCMAFKKDISWNLANAFLKLKFLFYFLSLSYSVQCVWMIRAKLIPEWTLKYKHMKIWDTDIWEVKQHLSCVQSTKIQKRSLINDIHVDKHMECMMEYNM